jgi:KaiC/GvpD/RAD55 family RecA-like ATPase
MSQQRIIRTLAAFGYDIHRATNHRALTIFFRTTKSASHEKKKLKIVKNDKIKRKKNETIGLTKLSTSPSSLPIQVLVEKERHRALATSDRI